ADYCTALEGVSHFVYSTWRLGRDLPVSLLELETQAEVDKYAVTVFLLADQQGGGYPAQVHARLFDRVSFDDSTAWGARQNCVTRWRERAAGVNGARRRERSADVSGAPA